MTLFTDSITEVVALAWLEAMGWSVVLGFEIVTDMLMAKVEQRCDSAISQ